MIHARNILILSALMLLAGCAQSMPAPTLAPTNTALPTPTIDLRPTLPPSWTPGPPPTVNIQAVDITEPPPPQPIEGRATLPPTWTPRPFVTVTPLPFVGSPPPTSIPPTLTPIGGRPVRHSTPRPDGPPTLSGVATYDAACAVFGKTEPTDTLVIRGAKARISWTPVEGAEGYRVWLLNPSKRYSFDEIVTGTTATFPEEAFIGPGNYAWEVMPLRNGDRMCVSLTGVITVRFS